MLILVFSHSLEYKIQEEHLFFVVILFIMISAINTFCLDKWMSVVDLAFLRSFPGSMTS